MFFLWMVLILYLLFVKSKSFKILILSALITSIAIAIRPAFQLLPVLFSIVIFIFLTTKYSLKRNILYCILFLILSFSSTFLWSTYNYITKDRFFFTYNAEITLQNFVAPLFVLEDYKDNDLQILKKHVAEQLQQTNKFYAMSYVKDDVMEEIGIKNEYDYYNRIVRKAIVTTIVNNINLFIKQSSESFMLTWNRHFSNYKSGYAEKQKESILFFNMFPSHHYLLYQKFSLIGFLIVPILIIFFSLKNIKDILLYGLYQRY
jgi:hypothetical protein